MDQLRASVTREEQYAFIKLHMLLGDTAAEIHRLLERAIRSLAMTQRQVYNVYHEFETGQRTGTERSSGQGRPRTSTDECMKERLRLLLLEDNDWGTIDYALELNVSPSSIKRMFHELGARKIASRWVPHSLTTGQKELRMAICTENLRLYNNDRYWLDRVIAIDETYLKSYDPRDHEAAKRWCLPDQDPPINVKSQRADWKVNFIAAFQGKKLIAHEYYPNITSITHEEFLDFLDRVLHPVLRGLRIHRPLIVMDNAGAHKHHEVQDYFTRHRWHQLRHPPFSPDLSPPDYDGFMRIKRPNKGTRFANFDELRTVYEVTIRNLNANEEFQGIQKLPERWQNCFQVMGDYFE